MPHFALECLKMIDEKAVPFWPDYDEKLLVENIIPFVIQINGKKRYVFDVNRNISEEQILKIINQNSNISKFLKNKEIKKKIFIANKLINIIV